MKIRGDDPLQVLAAPVPFHLFAVRVEDVPPPSQSRMQTAPPPSLRDRQPCEASVKKAWSFVNAAPRLYFFTAAARRLAYDILVMWITGTGP